MKKQVLFSVFFVVSIFFSANVFAQYPISSFDIPTAPGTYFTMSHATSPSMSAEKRKMNVNTTGGSSAPTSEFVTFMVYSLDMQSFQGPYTIQIGSSKSISIDERQWGLVVIDQTGDCLMSVYTESNDTH